MQRLQCEACGGGDFIKEGDYFVCEHCHVKYTTAPVATIEHKVSGVVEVVKPINVENLILRGNQFMKDGDFTTARKYFHKALDADPLNKEAQGALYTMVNREERDRATASRAALKGTYITVAVIVGVIVIFVLVTIISNIVSGIVSQFYVPSTYGK